MYQIKINETVSSELSLENNEIKINGNPLNWDMQALPNGSFSIIAENKSYVVFVEEVDRSKKTMTFRINNNNYTVKIQEPIDLLLAKMGFDISKTQKVEPVKAPMPGLILKVLVEEGQTIKKGEPVLILEAMKMENVFKATSDAIVKAIRVKEQQAVEKGEVLIELA
ncbi:MAG TPA: acetyl-CoA carboxylase biotin carboxyl carrier protein subunit [Edaphocola sp.]|nr:acetyl-CoA carboxylase biotin carboxyl carrier protein subunit [Edaphocola sp.]